MHHTIHLHPHRFQKVASGEKTIELRLYDEKRRGFCVGDTITFLERETEVAYQARIVALYVYPTFHALLENHARGEMGFSADQSLDDMITLLRQHYSQDDEYAYGVVAIQVESLAGLLSA